MPPRTNACATCRKKRIKCDATLPHCLMCIKFGRPCPGPTNGPIIIEMTPKIKSKRKVQPSQDASTILAHKTSPLIPKQISHRTAIYEFFYSAFLAHFTANGETEDIQNKRTWLSELPTLCTDGTNSALEMAVQAAASAFTGLKMHDMRLLHNASTLYGRALHTHSRLLSLQNQITVHMVSTSVLLSIFEAMHATTATAYCAHINGAARMVELAGPEACMRGVLCQMYYHIRTQLVFVYLTSKTHGRSPDSVEKTLREALHYKKLPVMQRLLTLISRLSEVYVRLEEGKEQSLLMQLHDADVFTETCNAIEAIEREYRDTATSRGEKLTWVTRKGTATYRNPYTAVCIAFFSTARFLLCLVAARLPVVHVDSRDYSQEILDAAAYLGTVKIGCTFMRISMPLFLVAMHAPQTHQRRAALEVFEEWKVTGLGGISALALERIHENGLKSTRAMLVCKDTPASSPTT